MKTINLLVITLVLTVSAFAQANQKVILRKVAVINIESFYDEKTGIKRLAIAEREMGMTDCIAMFRYVSLTKEIEESERKIVDLRCQKATVDGKLIQLQKLKDESKKASNEVDACKKIVREQRVDPIIEKIREKLIEFAKQKGYETIVDKLGSILVETEADDITSEFIQFCNDYFGKEKLK